MIHGCLSESTEFQEELEKPITKCYFFKKLQLNKIFVLQFFENFMKRCSLCIFINITDYAYEYKDVLPEVSALEMLRYGPGGGLPVKDEFDLQTVDRLRYQKMQSDNLPSVEESKRTLVQNRLLGMRISDRVMNISLIECKSM